MTRKKIVVVTDGVIEILPERLQSLNIHLVPREAKAGRRRWQLDGEMTAASLPAALARPAAVTVAPPTLPAFQQSYRRALEEADYVLAFHLPPTLDKDTAIQARLARNLLQHGRIRLYELPMPGLALATVVETVAEAACRNWDVEALSFLVDRLQAIIRSFFITPPGAIPAGRLSGGPVKGSFFGRPHLLTELAQATGRFQIRGHARRPADLVRQLTQQTPVGDEKMPLYTYWRQVKYQKDKPAFEAVFEEIPAYHQLQDGWSPLLYNQLGGRFWEACHMPTPEGLSYVVEHTWRLIDAARRTEKLTRGPLSEDKRVRLSDYRVRLK
jgi:hypothetical protein